MTRRAMLQMSAMLFCLRHLGFPAEKRVIEIGHLLKTFRLDPKIKRMVAHELTDAYPVPTRDALVFFFRRESPRPLAQPPRPTRYGHQIGLCGCRRSMERCCALRNTRPSTTGWRGGTMSRLQSGQWMGFSIRNGQGKLWTARLQN